MEKPSFSFWQLWNMSFGFLGIQFGWGLQTANMSAIYEYLGAKPDQIPVLWLAAPMTGLLVQPIIGSMSDRTWGPLGRRRPYFLVGALLASMALVLIPFSSSLWMAAGLLWVLDSSINISMEPFRAFVADLLPERQRGRGFAMQSLFIGLGAVIASALPWMLSHGLGVNGRTSLAARIPSTVRYSFYLGAGAFLGAVLWTVFTTREYPPEDMAAFRALKAQRHGFVGGAEEIWRAIKEMPSTMRRLAWVQIFTWLGLFCMGLYFIPAVAHNVFGAPNEKSSLYSEGTEWGGLCFSVSSLVTFFAAFGLFVASRRVRPKQIHTVCLLCGAAGLMSVGVIHDKYLLLLSMTGVGIATASIISMPYALLANSLPPDRIGVYMGIFNLFIVLPEIVASLGFGWVMNNWLRNDRLYAVVAGGVFMLLAAALMRFVEDSPATVAATSPVPPGSGLAEIT
jgi:maltose/moltooligosaccharide transporter